MKLSLHDYQLSMSLEFKCYETMEWNSPLRVSVSSKFHFISYDIAILETTLWNSPLRPALGPHGQTSHLPMQFAWIFLCEISIILVIPWIRTRTFPSREPSLLLYRYTAIVDIKKKINMTTIPFEPCIGPIFNLGVLKPTVCKIHFKGVCI